MTEHHTTKRAAKNNNYNVLNCNLLLTATLLLPFGVAAGDELVPPAVDGTSHPVSLSCQFYGVEEDTVHVRKENIISLQLHFIISMHT